MGKSIVEQDFFTRNAKKVAEDLLGKFICRQFNDGTVLRWCITETEAYDDDDVVTYKGKMFDGAGEWCPYNGMLMINCTSSKGKDNVLIRALDCVKGPCNIVDHLKIKEIKPEIEGKSVLCQETLWLEDGVTVKKAEPKPRVGIVKKAENQDALEAKNNYRAEAIFYPPFDFNGSTEAQ